MQRRFYSENVKEFDIRITKLVVEGETFVYLSLLLILLILSNSALYADEFDGGIPIDIPVTDKLEKDINIQYIKRNALSKSKRGVDDGTTGCDGTGNQTFGPGANLQGATIVNMSDNRGTTSGCFK